MFYEVTNPSALNFLDRSDHRIAQYLHVTQYSDNLTVMALEVEQETSVVNKEEETKLWTSGILGVHHPKALLCTTFFYTGKVFYLRGRKNTEL